MVSSVPSSGTGGKRADKWLFMSSVNEQVNEVNFFHGHQHSLKEFSNLATGSHS